jgi:hypothetical protein
MGARRFRDRTSYMREPDPCRAPRRTILTAFSSHRDTFAAVRHTSGTPRDAIRLTLLGLER